MRSTTRAGLEIEQALWAAGYRAVAGIDEVGRGAWAGPVVAAAVILPPDPGALAPLVGPVNDSKQLTPRARARMFDLIHRYALAVGVGSAATAVVDRVGILSATRQAMLAALADLGRAYDFVLVDGRGLTLSGLAAPQRSIVHGDALSLSIAAASIIAKVTRDRWMVELDREHPGYNFACHKGYGTAAHTAALARLGPCALHRLTFRPLRECVSPGEVSRDRA